MGLPRRDRPFVGRRSLGTDERLQAAAGRHSDLLRPLGVPGEEADDPVAQPADLLVESPHQVAGADVVVPARQHFTAQQRAVCGLHPDRPNRLGERFLRVLAQQIDRRHLVVDGGGDFWGPCHQRRDGAVEGTADDTLLRVLVGGQCRQVGPDRRYRGVRQQPQMVDEGLGNREQWRLSQPTLGHESAQITWHHDPGTGRYPVEHHGDGGPPLSGRQ